MNSQAIRYVSYRLLILVKYREHDISSGAGRLDRSAWLNFVTNRKSASDVLHALDTVLKVNIKKKILVATWKT